MSRWDWKKTVLLLIVILLLIPFIHSMYKDLSLRPKRESQFRLSKVFQQIKSFKKQCGVYPEKLLDLEQDEYCAGYTGVHLPTRDSWGNEFIYDVKEDQEFTLTSYGKGGKAGGKGDSEDLVLTSELTESQKKALDLQLQIKADQVEDGFLRIQCQNRPEKGDLGQSTMFVVIRRDENDGRLIAQVIQQTWSGSRTYSVELSKVPSEASQEGEDQTIELIGSKTRISLRKITQAANKWRAEMMAELINPGSDDEPLKIDEILVCKVRELEGM
ncbi:MAG: type II secretion system protein GspG [Bdellovibrionales bacterium]|nr:type II secretion system protein GspG [Bdellovibrionales bacterium]